MTNVKPQSLPAVYQYITRLAALTKLDWQNADDGLKDILEELEELKLAETAEQRFDEAGDVLFAMLNWMRWLGIDDPEAALSASAARFQSRLQRLQGMIAAQGKTLADFSTDELRAMWETAKREDKSRE